MVTFIIGCSGRLPGLAWRLLIAHPGLIRVNAANMTVLCILDNFAHEHETKQSTWKPPRHSACGAACHFRAFCQSFRENLNPDPVALGNSAFEPGRSTSPRLPWAALRPIGRTYGGVRQTKRALL